MQRIIRFPALIALIAFSIAGVASAAIWLSSSAGLIRPLIVISGSMEPAIETGDLLIARPVAAADIHAGDVITAVSPSQGVQVTHRVVDVSPDGPGVQLTMQGDANALPDAEPYTVSESAWTPWLQLGGWGTVVANLMQPQVMLSLLLAVIACGAILLLTPSSRVTAQS